MFITYRCIDNVDKQSRFIDPEFSLVLLTRTKFLYDLFYNMNRLSRMTILHFTTNNIGTAREYTMWRITIKLNEFIFINIRQIYWKMTEQQIDLL